MLIKGKTLVLPFCASNCKIYGTRMDIVHSLTGLPFMFRE